MIVLAFVTGINGAALIIVLELRNNLIGLFYSRFLIDLQGELALYSSQARLRAVCTLGTFMAVVSPTR